MKQKIRFLIANLMSNITAKINGPYVKGLLTENGEYSFISEVTDMSVGRHLRFGGDYGIEEKNRIDKLISKESSVAFVGTHIGSLAIPTATRVKRALFIEANPNTYKFLEANTKLNNVSNNVSFNIAVGEKDGEINFVLNKTNSGGSKREPASKEHMYYYDNPETVTVPMTTFDKLAADFSEGFDLVFMDIEGSEYFALKGMQKSLEKTESLIVEFIPHHLRNVGNVSVREFLDLIEPHFSYCYIPSKGKYLEIGNTYSELLLMFDADESDEGIVFSKSKVMFD